MQEHCPSAGQSLVAVHAIRYRSRTADAYFAEQPRAHSLFALADSFREIPDSFLVAGWHGKPYRVVGRSSGRGPGGASRAFYIAMDQLSQPFSPSRISLPAEATPAVHSAGLIELLPVLL